MFRTRSVVPSSLLNWFNWRNAISPINSNRCALHTGSVRDYSQPSGSADVKEKQLIDLTVAYKAIRKNAAMTFKTKELPYENLHEIFWTILYQRPDLRKNIVSVCKGDGEQYADYWNEIFIGETSIADVPRDIPIVTGDPLDASIVSGGPFLDFPEMHKLIFVNSKELVDEMSSDIERRAEGPDGVILALDAEESHYQKYSPACTLQISLDHVSYIVDLNVLPKTILRPFSEMIFFNPKIHKLGFMSNNDLRALRKAKSLKGCVSLYYPKNLPCILKLCVALTKESKKRSNAAEILEEFGAIRATPARIPSLSSICESLLGLPLDKRERLSAWTRRPLRPLQLRYAAMDAYCLLLLHSRCKEWAEKLGVPMEEMMEKAQLNVKSKR